MFSYRRSGLAEDLATYYAENESWDGFSGNYNPLRFPRPIGGPQANRPFPTFLLVDSSGSVVIPGHGYGPGEVATSAGLPEGIPIEVDGEQVGTLFMQIGAFDVEPAERAFLNRINAALAVGAVGGAAAAVVLGIVFSRSLTRPLRELTRGAQDVADGVLDTQVPVRSRDELGELAVAFNQMNSNLSRSRDLRRQMTADIAHELRTPISIILGHAEGIREGVLEASEENVDVMHAEARRLERLVEDLRMLSLVDAGELPMEIESVVPAELLQRAAASYRVQAGERNVELRLEIGKDLPNLEVDGDRMIQVLGNLLSNALRHTSDGGIIRLSSSKSAGELQITVADSGPGIASEDLEHVFDRFYRVDKSRRRNGGGSGLGLAIAKSLTEAQGGSIRAESECGDGTRFVISFSTI